MKSFRKIYFSMSDGSRRIQSAAPFSMNGNFDKAREPIRRYGLVGMSIGCAIFLWNMYKKTLNKNQASCEAELETKQQIISSPSSECVPASSTKISLTEAIRRSRETIHWFKDSVGLPGIIVGVSVNGRTVWTEGLGYSDIENRVPCTPNTVMRIASISKSITMAVVAKLWENGKLDLDKPIQEYVPEFPKKTVDDKPVEITCRHLVSHLSGIRHYLKKNETQKNDSEFTLKEYYSKDKYASVVDSLKLFQSDELLHKPGEKFLYTTYGWTLVSAALEKIIGEPFPKHMKKVFQQFGMTETYLDVHETLIPNRSHYYVKSASGTIENAPYVDNSYKWAGGGFLSTVGDLIKFGNIMLYSYQHGNDSPGLPGYLKQSTLKQMWTQVEKTQAYGMGWGVANHQQDFGQGPVKPFCAAHSGGAIGASSVLVIYPTDQTEAASVPSGVVVAIITNLQEVHCSALAKSIAKIFMESTG